MTNHAGRSLLTLQCVYWIEHSRLGGEVEQSYMSNVGAITVTKGYE